MVTGVTSTAGGQTVTSTAGGQVVSTFYGNPLYYAFDSALAAGATTVAKQLTLATVNFDTIGVANSSGSLVLPAGDYYLNIVVSTINTGTNITDVHVGILKNGSAVFSDDYQGPAVERVPVINHWTINSTGTEAFTFKVTVTYGAGTTTLQASVSLQQLNSITPTVTVPTVTSSVTIPTITNSYMTVPVVTTQFGAAVF